MERYNYAECVADDVRSYIEENGVRGYDEMYDDMFISDSVTGNGSGSYTFNTWQAEECVCHNLDLLEEACNEFGCDAADYVKKGAEWADVTIRCYMLGYVLPRVLDEYPDPDEEEE